jgi:hypothetical protein
MPVSSPAFAERVMLAPMMFALSSTDMSSKQLVCLMRVNREVLNFSEA